MREKDDTKRTRKDLAMHSVNRDISDRGDRFEEHEEAVRMARNFLIEKGVDVSSLVLIDVWKIDPENPAHEVISMIAEGAGPHDIPDILMQAFKAHVEALGGQVVVNEVPMAPGPSFDGPLL